MTILQQMDAMRERITDEILLALGRSKTGVLRRILGVVLRPATQRFASIFAAADDAVGKAGMPAGCRSAVESLGVKFTARGAENIPADGPLLLVSNHPGAYDSVAIGSCVPRRDLRIIVFETPFYHAMPKTDPWFIYAPADPAGRMQTLRTAIHHLQQGGSILQFGSGLIEPDPAVMPGADEALLDWSPSLEVLLRKIPRAQVVFTIASGVVLKRFARHPFTYFRSKPMDRRRLVEFTQVIWQLLFPHAVQVNMQLSFAPAVQAESLLVEAAAFTRGRSSGIMAAARERARRLLDEHRAVFLLAY